MTTESKELTIPSITISIRHSTKGKGLYDVIVYGKYSGDIDLFDEDSKIISSTTTIFSFPSGITRTLRNRFNQIKPYVGVTCDFNPTWIIQTMESCTGIDIYINKPNDLIYRGSGGICIRKIVGKNSSRNVFTCMIDPQEGPIPIGRYTTPIIRVANEDGSGVRYNELILRGIVNIKLYDKGEEVMKVDIAKKKIVKVVAEISSAPKADKTPNTIDQTLEGSDNLIQSCIDTLKSINKLTNTILKNLEAVQRVAK